MNEQGHPRQDTNEPHSTRFKEHLLKFLPDLDEFSKDFKGRKDTYTCNKDKVADELLPKSICHKLIRRMHSYSWGLLWWCIHFASKLKWRLMAVFLLIASQLQSMRRRGVFFNAVLGGLSALPGRDIISGDANLEARDKIACNISQLFIYNTSKGTHTAVKTAAVRRTKERETLFPLYQGIKLRGQGRTKSRLKLTINRVSQYHINGSWMLSLELLTRYVLVMLVMGLCCQPTAVWMSSQLMMWTI